MKYMLILCLAFLVNACDSGGGPVPTVMSNGDISVAGFSAAKGPFMTGSQVDISPLTFTTAATAVGTLRKGILYPTGKDFVVKTDGKGYVDISGVVFDGATDQFVQTNVEGYYFNEISGSRSSDYIALQGVVDLKGGTAMNVNILTHLARARTIALARANCPVPANSTTASTACTLTTAQFKAARVQAEQEVLAAFNIPAAVIANFTSFADLNIANIASSSLVSPPTDGDTMLLAVSALVMQIGANGSGVNQFVNDFEADLAADGKLDSTDLKNQILQASSVVNFSVVANNMNAFYKSSNYSSLSLRNWVDASGGVNGVINLMTEYYALNVGTSTPSKTSKVLNTAAFNGRCLNLVSTSATSSAVIGTTTVTSFPYLVPAGTTPINITITSAPSGLSSQSKLTTFAPTGGTCSVSSQEGLTGLYFFSASPSNLNLFATQFISDFAKCFNLTSTARVITVDSTNQYIPNATAVNALCTPLSGAPSVSFLNNGYTFGQNYFGMLTDGSMTKTARIVGMNVIDYFVANNNQKYAKINFTYVDRYDRKGNFIVSAMQDPTWSTVTAGGWYNVGNQHPADVAMYVGTRKFTTIPLVGGGNTTRSTSELRVKYQSAFLPLIDANGPGTVLSDGKVLTAVKVNGPGLPDAGLVYIPPMQKGQDYFDYSNMQGALPNAAIPAAGQPRCGVTPQLVNNTWTPVAPVNCSLNWIGQTNWVPITTPATAPTLITPTATVACPANSAGQVSQQCVWGGNNLPYNTAALMTVGTEYTFRLYYNNQTTPTFTFAKRLLTSAPDLTKAHLDNWVNLDMVGTASLVAAMAQPTSAVSPFEAFRPVAGETSKYLSWTGQVMNSVEIGSINTSLQLAQGPRATPGDGVGRGLTSGTLYPQLGADGVPVEMQYSTMDPTTGLPATSGTVTPYRVISLGYRTFDYSWKTHDYLFETAKRY